MTRPRDRLAAAVQRAVDDPDPPPSVGPSTGGKSVFFSDWDEYRAAFPPLDTRALGDATPREGGEERDG